MSWDDSTRRQALTWLTRLEMDWSAMDPGTEDTPDQPTRDRILASLRASIEAEDPGPDSHNATLYLQRLAHHFSGEDVVFKSTSQMHDFCERIRRSLVLLLTEFQELLAGRKKIQNDWSLYSSTTTQSEQGLQTREFRLGDVHGDLGRTLLDWRHPEETGGAASRLKAALEELKHHQVATMAGYERSVTDGSRALLEQLDPSSIEREYSGVREEASARFRVSIRRFNPLKRFALWSVYRRRFEQIASEDARWYQRQFLPAFRQGYRDYMISRMAPLASRSGAAGD